MSSTQPENTEFQDPLENYEPKDYDDALEMALVEEEIGTIKHEPYVTISPDSPVQEAIEKLAELHVACLLVAENDKLLGVFSERDVLRRVAFEYESNKDSPVREVMADNPIYVYETDSAVTALSVMIQCGYRHVPVLDANDNLTGIISPQRLTEFLMRHLNKKI